MGLTRGACAVSSKGLVCLLYVLVVPRFAGGAERYHPFRHRPPRTACMQVFHYFHGDTSAKDAKLLQVLDKAAQDPCLADGRTLIFCKDDQAVIRVHAMLAKERPQARTLVMHAKLEEKECAAALCRFGGGSPVGPAHTHPTAYTSKDGGDHALLVCAQSVARGLDFPDLRHVVLYDVPSDVRAYVHCVGRTARRGKEGLVTCLVGTREETQAYRHLHALGDAERVSWARNE